MWIWKTSWHKRKRERKRKEEIKEWEEMDKGGERERGKRSLMTRIPNRERDPITGNNPTPFAEPLKKC